jgi:hypothetical protein
MLIQTALSSPTIGEIENMLARKREEL